MGQPVVGDVVVLPFPQTNLQAGKRRPALVVANLPGYDLVLCQITSLYVAAKVSPAKLNEVKTMLRQLFA